MGWAIFVQNLTALNFGSQKSGCLVWVFDYSFGCSDWTVNPVRMCEREAYCVATLSLNFHLRGDYKGICPFLYNWIGREEG